MNYGVPYKGSKNLIATKLAEAIPSAENFYDLFAGGCAVTHKMLECGRFKRYYANDLDGQGLKLFTDAVNGKYKDEKRWISREDFSRLKDSDPYVACCWSFGNNQKNYMYAKEIEPWKKAQHYAMALGDFSLMEEFGIHTDGSRKDVVAHEAEYKRKYIKWWLSQQEYSEEELNVLIERCKGRIAALEEELRQYLLRGLESSGLTQAEVGRRLGTQMQGHYFGKSQWAFPTQEHYDKMRAFMPALDKDYNEVIGLHNIWQSLQRLERLQSLQSLQSLQRLQRLESLQSLQRLERLQRLQSLQRLERLEASFMSYDEVKIKPDSVIYCDPPYRGTSGYKNEFDHERFYDWCCQQKELVLVSEYEMPRGRFTEVWSKNHRSRLSRTANNGVTERLFVPTRQLAKYREMMRKTFGPRKPKYIQLDLFPEMLQAASEK